MTKTIRFFGTRRSLELWGPLVEQLTGRKPGPIVNRPDRYGGRLTIDVELSREDRELIQEKAWYEETEHATTAGGDPLTWNMCVAWATAT